MAFNLLKNHHLSHLSVQNNHIYVKSQYLQDQKAVFSEQEYIILEINALAEWKKEWKQVTTQCAIEVLIKPPEV